MKEKVIYILSSLLFFSLGAFAQAEETTQKVVETTGNSFFTVKNITALVFGAFIIYALWELVKVLVRLREIKIYKKYGITQYQEEKSQSYWERVKRMFTNAVPLGKEEDIDLDHEYDGIRELDNDLPPWWLWMFYITIAIGVAYFAYYHVLGWGMSSSEAYAHEMKVAKEEVDKYLATQANLVDETNVVALTDANELAKGKETYDLYCAACHLADGGGSVGPNLTDDYWLHGNSIQDIFKTVKYGVPEKGMISWKTQLSAVQMQEVASYILTLHGTTPANPKEPQGELITDAGGSSAPATDAGTETDSKKEETGNEGEN